MKTVSLVLLSILGSALAAPAVVWKNGQTEATVRTSTELKASDLLSEVLTVEPEVDSLSSVIFVIGRSEDGTESLSALASSGALPNVQKEYDNADCIHHHVSGIESPDAMVRSATQVGAGHKVVPVSLGELNSKLESIGDSSKIEVDVAEGGVMSKAQKYAYKRSKDMAGATVLIVKVDPRADSSVLDRAVVSAIQHKSVSSVVLTAVRSHDEVKHERFQENRRRLSKMKTTGRQGRRRLEDQQQEEDNGDQQQNNNNNDDMTGVYYVSMTPNILAGILFTLLFATVTWIGISCMGMIQGQDVYVKKMPMVGREA